MAMAMAGDMRLWCGLSVVAALVIPVAVMAQTAQRAQAPATAAPPAPAVSQGPPNALQGFAQNRDEPVKVKANRLDIQDKIKIATFYGDVKVSQGDTTLECQTLVIYYEANKPNGGGGAAASPDQPDDQQIRRIEATEGVVVTQKDQTATSDVGIFDLRANTATLNGNVVLMQGQSVLQGERLTVDLATGFSKMDGRVKGKFVPAAKDTTPAATGAVGPLPLRPR
jgi:lipopolysaccharide export system protein LptA